MVSSTHEQNSICSQKQLNDIAHEHTIICRQLFAGHVVGSRPMKRKKHLHGMIIIIIIPLFTFGSIYNTYAIGAEQVMERNHLNQT